MLLGHFSPFILQFASSFLCLSIIFILFHYKNKKFFSSDPSPELKYLNTLKKEHLTSGVTTVKTGMFIKNFSDFDLVKNNFVMDAILWFEFNPIQIPLSTIDNFSFDRGKIVKKSEPEIKVEGDNYFVKYHIQLQFTNNLDFHFFPFDHHRLNIVLVNETVSPLEMVFEVEASSFSWPKDLHTADWKIVEKNVQSGYSESILDKADPNKKISHPEIIFNMNCIQKGLRKPMLIFLPVFFLLFMSSFLLNSDPVHLAAPMLIIGAASLSGLLTYRFVTEVITPKVGYSTLTDYFFNAALICNGLTFILIFFRVNLPELESIQLLSHGWTVLMPILLLIYVGNRLHKHHSEKIHPRSKHTSLKNSDKKINKEAIDLEKKFNLKFLNEYALTNKETSSIDHHKKTSIFRSAFKHVLLTPAIEQEKTTHGDFILKLNPGENAKIIVFGDLHGAFHSLLRGLNQLEKQGIIDENLHILQNNTTIIFNGNVIEQSPFILETLTLVLRLTELNPHQVFYIKGQNESHEVWRDNKIEIDLKNQLKHFYEENNLGFSLEKFFHTLPVALYIKSSSLSQNELMRISNAHFTEFSWDEIKLKDFLEENNHELIKTSPIQKYQYENEAIKLDAIISNRTNEMIRKTTKGLALLNPEQGATTWGLSSPPNLSLETSDENHDDSFIEISLKNSLLESTLTLWQQDTRELTGYYPENFHLVYGSNCTEDKPNPLHLNEPFNLGSSIDFSKTASRLGKSLYEGLNMGIRQQNNHGGINSSPIRLIALDDKYIPEHTYKNAKYFLDNQKTNILLSPLGSKTTESLLPLAEDKRLLVLFPMAGSDKLRNKEINHVIHFRTSYAHEADALVTYAIEKLQLERFAIFYQNDSLGLGPLDIARKKLTQHGVKDWFELPYQRNIQDTYTASAHKITEFNPDAVLFFSAQSPATALVHSLGIDQLAGKTLLGISFITDAFRDFLHTSGLELIIARVVPDIHASTLPIVKEFKNVIAEQTQNSIFSIASFEGYINAQILISVLKTLTPPYTKEKIITALENMKNVDFGGLILNFDPDTRELTKNVWIDTGREWLPSNGVNISDEAGK